MQLNLFFLIKHVNLPPPQKYECNFLLTGFISLFHFNHPHPTPLLSFPSLHNQIYQGTGQNADLEGWRG